MVHARRQNPESAIGENKLRRQTTYFRSREIVPKNNKERDKTKHTSRENQYLEVKSNTWKVDFNEQHKWLSSDPKEKKIMT